MFSFRYKDFVLLRHQPTPFSFMLPKGAISVEVCHVDADNAVFEPLGVAPDAADVAAVIGGEAGFGVVGHLDGRVIGLGAVERATRPKVSSLVMTTVPHKNAVGADLAPHSAGLTAIAGSEAAPLARLASSLVVEFRG